MAADQAVFSTYVEVIPPVQNFTPTLISILHVCGGDPQFDHNVYKWKEVFSTYVEVILSAKCAFLFW